MDFLAAIEADPDDLALRAVWADALLEAGDPRGELVALQLAGARTYAAWQRERELVGRHGAAWAGALDRAFYAPVFEHGVFAGGMLRLFADRAQICDEPGWPLVRLLDGNDRDPTPLLDHPRSRIARLGLDSTIAPAFLAAARANPRRGIVELGLRGAVATTDLEAIDADGFPDVTALAFAHVPDVRLLAWLATAPIVERLARVVIGDAFPSRAILDALATRAGALRTVEVRDPQWWIRFERAAAPGPFTRVVAWYHGSETAKHVANGCRAILDALDPTAVTAIEIAVGRAMRPTAEVARLTALLEAMPRLARAALPWEFVPRAAPPPRVWAGSIRDRATAFTDHADRAWTAFAEDLGIAFDVHSANGRGAPPLGKQPRAKLAERAATRDTERLGIAKKGASDRVMLVRHAGLVQYAVIPAPARADDDEMVAWFVRTVAHWPGAAASLGIVPDAPVFAFQGYAWISQGWLVALPAPARAAISDAALRAAGLAPIHAATHLVFALADTPEAVTDAARAAACRVVVDGLDAHFAPRGPAWFAPALRRILDDDRATGAGLTFTRGTTSQVVWTDVHGRELAFRLRPSPEGWALWVSFAGSHLKDGANVDAAALPGYVESALHWVAIRPL